MTQRLETGSASTPASPPGHQELSRRSVLAGAFGVAAAGLLTGCGGGDNAESGGSTTTAPATTTEPAPSSGRPSPTATAGSSTRTSGAPGAAPQPPASVPYTGVTPDLPAGEHGIPAAYFSYPANPPTFSSGQVGSGGSVSMMLQGNAIPTPEGKNRWWQALNQAMNVDIDFRVANTYDYQTKLQTLVAGGDLPDMLQVVTVPQLPQVLASSFADLTEYLSGDAIKDYPGLAANSRTAWQIPTINRRIWGIPLQTIPAGVIPLARTDLLDKYGLKLDLTNGQDFLDLCKKLTDVKHNRWAAGQIPTSFVLPILDQMTGAPNSWQVKDGTFTSVNQSAERRQSLDILATMWKNGYLHPDSFTTTSGGYDWWKAGTTTLFFAGTSVWTVYAEQYPSWNITVPTLPKWAGGGQSSMLLGPPAYYAFVGFKKAKASRVQELLRVANYIASPFGTKEYLTVNYGVAGVDYDLHGSDPVPNKTATSEVSPIHYAGSHEAAVLYLPGHSDVAKAQHEYLSSVLPTGVANPTIGLYSATALSKGASADTALRNVMNDVVQGRKSISDWDNAVKSWVNQAGADMAREYEKAYAASH